MWLFYELSSPAPTLTLQYLLSLLDQVLYLPLYILRSVNSYTFLLLILFKQSRKLSSQDLNARDRARCRDAYTSQRVLPFQHKDRLEVVSLHSKPGFIFEHNLKKESFELSRQLLIFSAGKGQTSAIGMGQVS